MEDQEAEEPKNKRPLLERNVFASEDDFEDEIIEETTPLELDVLGPRDAKGNAIILGKAFRSNELSEEALREPEKQAPKEQQLEEAWNKEEDQHFLKTTLGQATIAALSLFIIAGIWALITLGSEETSDSSEQRAQVVEQQIQAASTAAELRVLKEKNIELCIKNYLEATNYEERAKWCRNPEATLKKMMLHQSRGNAFQKYNYNEQAYITENYSNGIPIVLVNAECLTETINPDQNQKPELVTLMLLEQPDGKYGVDWETAVTYQPDDLNTFINTKSTEPHTFRAMVMDTVNKGPYLYPFNDDGIYQAYHVTIGDNPDSYLIAYAKKDSPIDLKLKETLKIDTSNKRSAPSEIQAPLILKLSYPKDPISPRCVEIIEILSDSWFQS